MIYKNNTKHGGASCNGQKGFTIIELLIATTVFSMVMLLSSTGLIYIGKTYYKGAITAKTQDTTRSIIEEISRQVQFSSGQGTSFAEDTALDIKSYCIGQMKYTKVNNPQLKMSASASANTRPHLLWADKLNSGALCTATAFSSGTSRDMLSQNMRLADFKINSSNTAHTISIGVYYGDADLVDGSGACKGTSDGGQFCARSALTSVATRRIG